MTSLRCEKAEKLRWATQIACKTHQVIQLWNRYLANWKCPYLCSLIEVSLSLSLCTFVYRYRTGLQHWLPLLQRVSLLQMTYSIKVQLLEIYNEQLRDLLDTSKSQRKLDIRSTEPSGLNVPDAIQVSVLYIMRQKSKFGHDLKAPQSHYWFSKDILSSRHQLLAWEPPMRKQKRL